MIRNCLQEPDIPMSLNLRSVILKLEVPEIEKILGIDLDEDPQKALEFIKEVLAKRVKESLQPH